MGTHPSNPSKDLTTGRTLLDLVTENRALLSQTVIEKYGPQVPFLFKVLSINQSLSIQAHPDKKHAEELHARDPKNYKDDNHKPEMSITLTPFECLYGFRALSEISHFLETIPSLRSLVGDAAAAEFVQTAKQVGDEISDAGKKALQKVFGDLMSSSQEDVAKELSKLVEQAKSEGENFAGGGVASTKGAVLAELVERIYGQYGDDIGLFVMFLLNYLTLQPGEALFMGANGIHAYLSGDIIECMASSDNVVRAGLTPKFKDVDTLVGMLDYNYAPVDQQKMVPTDYPYAALNRQAYSSGSKCHLFNPPIDEFAVIHTVLKGGRI